MWRHRAGVAVALAVMPLAIGGCTFPPPEPIPTPTVATAAPTPAATTPAEISPTVAPPTPSPTPSPVPATSAIAFVQDGNIWTVGRDGSGARRLTTLGDVSTPRWSPDGRRLLFTRGAGTAAELHVAGGDGGPPRRLTSNARAESAAAWSPGGDRVAYSLPTSTALGGPSAPSVPEEIWVIDTATGAEWKVADGFDPAWSPDGARLAYATNGRRQAERPSGPTGNAIHVVDADGRNDRRLLDVTGVPQDLEPEYRFPFKPGTFRLRAPSWSPDGRQLVASADGHTSMAITFDEGGQHVRVWALAYEGSLGVARWSPRGDRLAVEVRPATGVDVVVLVHLASRRETRIGGPEPGFAADSPTWSSDGRRLALVARALDDPRRQAPPRELRTLTAAGAPIKVVATGSLADPDWNPVRP